MAPRRPQLSITLPRNFTFHYTDGQGPRTPEADGATEPRQPSPPRVDRVLQRGPASIPRRRPRPSFTGVLLQDVAVPSIEMPEHQRDAPFNMTVSTFDLEADRLAPKPTRLRFVTPVRDAPLATTPAAHDPYARRAEWCRPEEAESDGSMSRPPSACSIFSDSSVSSSETSGSFPSTGDGTTSPECDADFPTPTAKGKGKARADAFVGDVETPMATPNTGRALKLAKWTEEMDRHLWATYLLYLQDPTVTPFRSDPGRAPPLGVCHRVAREAKRTWRGSRPTLGPIVEIDRHSWNSQDRHQPLRDVHDEGNAVMTPAVPGASPADDMNSSVRREPNAPRSLPRWPRSDSATRRRLRELCQKRATHSSRLQRTLQSRSPTPADNRRPGLASPFSSFADPVSFSTRALSLSLTASTSTNMGPNGPLARLAQEGDHRQETEEGWFGQPVAAFPSSDFGPSQSDHSASGFRIAPSSTRLGSPFLAASSTVNVQPSHERPSLPLSRPHTNAFSGHRPALRSPVKFTSTTLPLPGVIKRRAQRLFEDESGAGGSDMRRNILEDLLGSPVLGGGHRRLRSRGFSVGDVSAADRLASLFRPPTANAPMDRAGLASPIFSAEESHATTPAGVVQPAPSDRLGSPFESGSPVRGAGPALMTTHQRTGSVQAPHDVGFSYVFDQTRSDAI